jgi:hypothetical protein
MVDRGGNLIRMCGEIGKMRGRGAVVVIGMVIVDTENEEAMRGVTT